MYVGKHGNNKSYFTGSLIINNMLKKYEKEEIGNFLKKEIVVEGDFNQLLLNELERHYIRLFATRKPYGYNLTDGGDGNQNFDAETRHKISISNKGKVGAVWSPEQRLKISIILKSKGLSGTKIAHDRAVKGANTMRQRGLIIKGHNNRLADKNTYCFVNIDGKTFVGGKFELIDKYSLNHSCINSIINGSKKSYRGWYLNKVDRSGFIKRKDIVDKNLIKEYCCDQLTLKELSIKYSVSVISVRLRLLKSGIEVRDERRVLKK